MLQSRINIFILACLSTLCIITNVTAETLVTTISPLVDVPTAINKTVSVMQISRHCQLKPLKSKLM